jgi:tetratricopeptide (TPR) repeat protein
LDHADRLLAGGDAALRGRARRLRADVETARRLDDIRRDLRLTGDSRYDFARVDEEYQEAFADYGIDVDKPDEAAAAIRGSAIRDRLTAALDDWAMRRKDRERRVPLLTVARRADDDAQRNAVRQALIEGDVGRLAKEAAGSDLPAETAVLLAQGLSGHGRTADAVAVLRRADEQHPDDYWVNLYLAFFLAGGPSPDYAEAARFASAVRALRPDSSLAHFNLGVALHYAGRRREAMAAYRRALDLDPKDAEAQNNLGVALEEEGRTDEAADRYGRAAALRPEWASAHLNLGNACLKLGRTDDALAAYGDAVRLADDWPDARLGLGQALQAAGRFPEARTALLEGWRRCPVGSPLWWMSWPWLFEADDLATLDADFDAIARGDRRPADAREGVAFAALCHGHGRYAVAARFWEGAFADRPGLADELDETDASRRCDAARSAARAGCGAGADAAGLDAAGRARLRRQALAWLRDDLTAWAARAGDAAGRPAVREALRRRRFDPELACVRAEGALDELPMEEQAEWKKLWADSATALREADAAE